MALVELSKNKEIPFIISKEESQGIFKIAEKVMEDVRQTTQALPFLSGGETGREIPQAVLAVTAGTGKRAEALEARFPELRQVQGKWEVYGFYLAEHPMPGVKTGLIVYGSNKLGTIYGLFHLSELLGVSPCKFWGDVPYPVYEKAVLTTEKVQKQGKGEHWIHIINGISKEPSVKYRGFFINDEWPCFGNWTFSHFGGFTAEMYDKVFEYLLRMKGNYLWPAMWTSSFFLDGPDMASMELADAYGIYIGMSHHEPCMRSSEEWDLVKGKDTPYGEAWSYQANAEGLLTYWEEGLKRCAGHSVFPVLGMRGERDSKMLGDDAQIEENVRILKEIITKQKELVKKYFQKQDKEVPLMFAVYKEVEDYYFGDKTSGGLQDFEELDGVTLLLCEDNFGNMRALPKPEERSHKGGFGMYYHLDYHGGPVSYEWLASVPLSKIWEQMTMAYEYGVRELWIVNAGDLKFQEYPLNYFMELAYDFEAWGSSARNKTKEYTEKWVRQQFLGCAGSGIFGQEEKAAQCIVGEDVKVEGISEQEGMLRVSSADREFEACMLEQESEDMPCVSGTDREFRVCVSKQELADIQEVLEGYIHLNHLRRPESCNDTVYHPAHFEEARRMLETCMRLERKNQSLLEKMEEKGKKEGYFSMIYYPAAASLNLLKMHLYASLNHLYAKQGKAIANVMGDEMEACIQRDEELSQEMAAFAHGKWAGMELAPHIGFTNWNCEDWRYPVSHVVRLPKQPRLVVSRADEEAHYTNQYFPIPLEISDFLETDAKSVALEIANGGMGTLSWEIREACPWLCFSAKTGETEYQDRLLLTIDRQKLSQEEESFSFYIRAGEEAVPVLVKAGKRSFANFPSGLFLAQKGMFTIPAVHYAEKKAGSFQGTKAEFQELKDFGKYESGVKVFPVTADFHEIKDAPCLTYVLLAEEPGVYCLEVHTSPANPLVYGGSLQYGVSINAALVQNLVLVDHTYKGGDNDCTQWEAAVLAQEHMAEMEIELKKGVNQITLYAQEAGVVLERLVLYPKHMQKKESYLGDKPSCTT